MKHLLLALALTCFGTAAFCGAWPREEGKLFVSAASRLKWPQDMKSWTSTNPIDVYDTVYLEYGFSDKLTIGVDWGRSVSGQTKKIIFAQTPLRLQSTGSVMSVQFGLGQIHDERVIRPGLSIGWPRPNGWISIDSTIEFVPRTRDTDLKIDATWGRNLPKNRKLILQLQTGDSDTDPPFLRIAPSIVLPAGRRFKTELGGAWGLIGDDTMGIKMGVWAEF